MMIMTTIQTVNMETATLTIHEETVSQTTVAFGALVSQHVSKEMVTDQ